ncbi:neutral/alkaline non-lysosomal ceramidase N-terminal domain-containing protein [Paenibacillus eucommiae]|uniref:Neutral/alkaline non-lysosomal ceramidase N-terminal domain-containing protein n=1 Tax=Paenibacillus eucommiae TaxID=1355755 RepID=A0ABS4ILU8_9BACL|nr:neutral/alkaline non-lysosomal ceramidase N-terminal domain-containing protein [Paenibacillus eucommiae]MBP1988545.1 hypothetical protein [Paenibacillus eucommiae]
MIKCGVSEQIITPPLGNSIPGYFEDRKSTGIKDELFAKSLVIESEGVTLAFIAMDCIDLDSDIVKRIRDRVHQFSAIPQSSIMISASHTHTGPPVQSGFIDSRDEHYLSFMVQKAADAAILAFNSRREAKIGFGSGEESSIAFNRRFFLKDGSFATNPGILNPLIDRAAGPIDPEVAVIRIDDIEGNPLGVVTNYACHTDAVGGTEYSADYPGKLAAELKRLLGGQTASLFLMGASGNINHIDVSGRFPRVPNHYLTMGKILAGEVVKVREAIIPSEHVIPLAVKQTFFSVAHRKPSEQDVQAAHELLEAGTESLTEQLFAQKALEVVASEENHSEVELQVFRIGELAVVGLPCELFVEFGLEIKQKSPFKYTIINELCNGSATGYISTREAYEQGGYEPRITARSKLAVETGEQFVQFALKALHELI